MAIMKINKLWAALLPVLVCVQTQGKPLQDELLNVLTDHPLIRANRHATDAARERVGAAEAANLPRLSLTGDGGLESIRSTSYRPSQTMELGSDGVVTPGTSSDLIRRKVGVSVEQVVYDGGRNRAAVDLATADVSMQGLNLQSLTQDLLLEALTAYLQVGRYQTLIGLSRLNEDTTRNQLELESKRVEGGGGIAVDVMQARTRLQIVKERRVFYEQALRDAMANYEQTFGRAPDIAQLQDLGIFQAGLPASLPEALNLGLNQSPRLKLSAMQISKAGDQILAARAGGGPVVDLVGARNYDRGANATAKRDDYSMLLRLNWSFSAGNENDHRVSAALKDKDELMERDVAQRNKVREAIRVSWNQLVNGRERLELLDSAAGIARDVMLNRKRLRDAGKETALSALDAEVEYFGVLANKINAMYDTRIGAYRLMAAVGGLTPEAVGLGNGFKLPVQPLKVDLQAIAGQGAH